VKGESGQESELKEGLFPGMNEEVLVCRMNEVVGVAEVCDCS
jgi:hypothetical protein